MKHWNTWISNITSITCETLIYINIKHKVILVMFDIHVFQCFTSYTCSVWYSCISMFHQLILQCLIFMYFNVSPVMLIVFDIHVYQCFTSYSSSVWNTWISNITSITGETLIYMNIKHCKFNWWNIDIHEYQTLEE